MGQKTGHLFLLIFLVILMTGRVEGISVSLQDQLFILTGVFGGVSLIPVLLVIALFLSLISLKETIRETLPTTKINPDKRPNTGHKNTKSGPVIPHMTGEVNQGYLPDVSVDMRPEP